MDGEMTVSEAAELLQVHRVTVWQWVKDGHFGRVRRKGLGATSPIMIPDKAVVEVALQLGIDLTADVDT